MEENVKKLQFQVRLLQQALTEACREAHIMGYCYNRGKCIDLNSDCLKCLYKRYIDKAFNKVTNGKTR